jgi:hypothetical protein
VLIDTIQFISWALSGRAERLKSKRIAGISIFFILIIFFPLAANQVCLSQPGHQKDSE